jgi:hypothetical protein
MFPFVLGAVDVGQIIGLCVLVVSVLSWFVNVIQGNTPDGAPRQPKAKPGAQTGRVEIEHLLQELAGDKSKPKRERERREQPPRPARSPSERGQKKVKSAPQRPGGPPPYVPTRPTPRVSETHLPSSNPGAAIRAHQIGSRVDVAVSKDLTATVQHDLGNRISAALPPERPKVHPLINLLREPAGIRQAILMNEILQRPRASRR